MDDDTNDAALHQQQLEERQRWESHIDALRDFNRWQREMDEDWDRIKHEQFNTPQHTTRRDKTCHE